jgi:hypothetical protein
MDAFPRSPCKPLRSKLFRLHVEAMEERLLLATFTVTNVDDAGDGSLRSAIQAANANPGLDAVDFQMPGTGVQTIRPQSPLPFITDSAIIDGFTQPGSAPGQPVIELDGSSIGADDAGLTISAGNSTVRGFVINRFGGSGIVLQGNGGNVIEGNFLGTDFSGTFVRGNGSDGVSIVGSPGNTIGGTTAGSGNVISGNAGSGVSIIGGDAVGNLVVGNRIGTDANGTTRLANSAAGVSVGGGTGTTIGVTADPAGNPIGGARNIISGNGTAGSPDSAGVVVSGGAGTRISGNFLGTDVTGAAPLPNLTAGVLIIGGVRTIVGGTSAATVNLISGNSGAGVAVSGGAGGTLISGNLIGTDASGTDRLANTTAGVSVGGGTGTTIGVTVDPAGNPIGGARNIISGNDGAGVAVSGLATATLIAGNYIGTDANGTARLANSAAGVLIIGGVRTIVGGTSAATVNLISGNDGAGVAVSGLAIATLIAGNFIGTDVTGTSPLGNSLDGVRIFDAPGNTVGGTAPGAGNVISGNLGAGVSISDVGAAGNVVAGNRIGTNFAGTSPLGNRSDGLNIVNAQFNRIGGPEAGAGNLISGNAGVGVSILGPGARANVVAGNRIGTDAFGIAALGNGSDGVRIDGAPGNIIGGSEAGARNVISGNAGVGVSISDVGAAGNVVAGNRIGTNFAGTSPLGNRSDGLNIVNAQFNRIGGPEAGAGNLISGNAGVGVSIFGPDARANVVAGNRIGTDAPGTSPLGNGSDGVRIVNAPGNVIGRPTAVEGNLISGNAGVGVSILGPGARANVVAGNRIGTDAFGIAALGNGSDGVRIDGAPGNIIGGSEAGARNVISGGFGSGISIFGPGAAGNVVAGNYIGTDAAGTARLGNGLDGVTVNNAPRTSVDGNVIASNGENGVELFGPATVGTVVIGNAIGLAADGVTSLGNGTDGVLVNSAGAGGIFLARNVISANAGAGIEILGDTEQTTVRGNLIGTDATGTVARGNQFGVFLNDAVNNTIGGVSPDARNVISGNVRIGILISGLIFSVSQRDRTRGNAIQGNFIGANATGAASLGNGAETSGTPPIGNGTGVFINDAPNNTIGGSALGAGNLISGNLVAGIQLFRSGATNNLIVGNSIGVDAVGAVSLANDVGVLINDAPANFVAANIISGNRANGVQILNRDATGNLVTGNLIGIDRSGTRAVTGASPSGDPAESRQDRGVFISDAAGNTVEDNVISGNLLGVQITGLNAISNVVRGNRIGTDAAGVAAVGNTIGVFLDGASANLIGGTTTAARNIISGNSSRGVSIEGRNARRNLVQGNFIGLGADGRTRLPNVNGVFIRDSPLNTIGGGAGGARNVISANAETGVFIFGAESVSNVVQGNFIGTDAGGAGSLGNGQYGVLLFNASNNGTASFILSRNRIRASGLGNFREFTGTAIPRGPSRPRSRRPGRASGPGRQRPVRRPPIPSVTAALASSPPDHGRGSAAARP